MNEVEKYGLFAIIAVAALITALTLSTDDEGTPAAAAVSAGQPVVIPVPDRAPSKPVGKSALKAASPSKTPSADKTAAAADAGAPARAAAAKGAAAQADSADASARGARESGRRLPVPKHVPSLVAGQGPFDPDEAPVSYPGERSWTPPAVPSVATGPRTHVVAAGDTLSSIAKTYLGRATRWNEIAALNPGLDPERLQVGQTVVVAAAPRSAKGAAPAAAPTASKAASTASKQAGADGERYVIVQAGDTLGEIAMRELGSVRHTDALFESNRDVLASPDALMVGQRLRLPRP